MTAWIDGHVDAADWLFLIGAVLAALAAVLAAAGQTAPPRLLTPGVLFPAAVALVAVGLLVL